MPIACDFTYRVIVGHLHNLLAKKRDAPEINDLWGKLAEFCAGGTDMHGQPYKGGRLIGMDANMAMFGVVQELAERGVGVTLLCHHAELMHPKPASTPACCTTASASGWSVLWTSTDAGCCRTTTMSGEGRYTPRLET